MKFFELNNSALDIQTEGSISKQRVRGLKDAKRQMEDMDKAKEQAKPGWVGQSERNQIVRRGMKKNDAKKKGQR